MINIDIVITEPDNWTSNLIYFYLKPTVCITATIDFLRKAYDQNKPTKRKSTKSIYLIATSYDGIKISILYQYGNEDLLLTGMYVEQVDDFRCDSRRSRRRRRWASRPRLRTDWLFSRYQLNQSLGNRSFDVVWFFIWNVPILVGVAIKMIIEIDPI